MPERLVAHEQALRIQSRNPTAEIACPLHKNEYQEDLASFSTMEQKFSRFRWRDVILGRLHSGYLLAVRVVTPLKPVKKWMKKRWCGKCLKRATLFAANLWMETWMAYTSTAIGQFGKSAEMQP